MDAEQIKQALYEKMAAEQEKYRSWLLEQNPEEIIRNAYEYVIKAEILLTLNAHQLPAEQAAALLASPTPLADTFQAWELADTHFLEDIFSVIERHAGSLMKDQYAATCAIPLYQENAAYAREHNELDLFRASKRANIACRDAIDNAILVGYYGEQTTPDVKGVLDKFGPERVTHVLATTLRERNHVHRFSSDNISWAASVAKFEIGTRHAEYALDSHPVLLDDFISMVRKELNVVKEQPEQAAKKSSIKEQLAAKPIPGDQPVKKTKDLEVR